LVEYQKKTTDLYIQTQPYLFCERSISFRDSRPSKSKGQSKKINIETLAPSGNEERQNKKHNTTQKPKPMSGTQVTLLSSDNKVYSIQLYGTKFVGNMCSISGCLRVL
jgi:hypothetical protein